MALLALATGEETANVEQKSVGADANGEQVRNQRGVYDSLGDYGHQSQFGGGDEYDSHDWAGSHHHEHVKTVTIEKKIPTPYYVHKHIPYTVEKKVIN